MARRTLTFRYCCLCGLVLGDRCTCPWHLPFGQWPLTLRERLVAKVRKASEKP